jgi:hypothetical protein
MNISGRYILYLVLIASLFAKCQCSSKNSVESEGFSETTLKEASKEWPEMPQQITFIGLKDCPTKFQVYWNGAVSCFVGRDCFGNIFPPQIPDLKEAHLWINYSGYKILVPTDKELPADIFPVYSRKLHLAFNKLNDENNCMHAAINDFPSGSKPGETINLAIALPYFPIEQEKERLLSRNYKTKLENIRQYWQYFYDKDVLVETPDPFVNDFYKAGLWHTLVTADRDPNTDMTYAKLSPAWYETFWPYINYADVVPMHLIDCDVIESNSDISRWI